MYTLPSTYDADAEPPNCSKCSKEIDDVTQGIWHCENCNKEDNCTTDICTDCKSAPPPKETEEHKVMRLVAALERMLVKAKMSPSERDLFEKEEREKRKAKMTASELYECE
jgi:hypothetical protein